MHRRRAATCGSPEHTLGRRAFLGGVGGLVGGLAGLDSLGHPLLVSQAFAAAAADSRGHLVSLGRHRLRGVREETELFTLAR